MEYITYVIYAGLIFFMINAFGPLIFELGFASVGFMVEGFVILVGFIVRAIFYIAMLILTPLVMAIVALSNSNKAETAKIFLKEKAKRYFSPRTYHGKEKDHQQDIA